MSTDYHWPQVGKLLAQARRDKAHTLQQVQDATGLSRPTLIRAEKGADIQLSTLHKLLSFYGVPLLSLVVPSPAI